MTIGKRIKEKRKEKGLTQKALGIKCQMPDSQIRQYELGMVNPKIEQVQRIATALECNISDLLSISEIMPVLKKECGKKENITNIQEYLESLGYTVLREEITRTVKKDYIDFELSNKEKEILDKYGYVIKHELPYFIQKGKETFRLSEEEFDNMKNEVNTSIEFQLWKHRVQE